MKFAMNEEKIDNSNRKISKNHDDTSKYFRVPHSEIEKSRRKKINKCLSDLSGCLFQGQKKKKIDKLSILKMTVARMKNLKG